MNPTDIAVLTLGGIASIAMVISALSTKRTKLLLFAIICSIVSSAQFYLAEAPVASAVVLVGAVRNALLILSIKKSKYEWLGKWPIMVLFMLISIGVWTTVMNWEEFELLSIVPLAGSILASLAVFFKNLIYTKSILMGVGLMWLSYELSYETYGAMVGEATNFICNGIALTLLIRAAMTGKEAIDIPTEAIRTITTSMPAITKAITTAIPTIATTAETATISTKNRPSSA